MLVLSKLTNINHASGGSYDPPLFLYSALFAAKGRFGAAAPPGGGLWRGFPARRRGFGGGLAGAALPGGGLLRGFPARRRGFRGFPARRRAFAGLPCTAAALWRVAPPGGALRGCTARRRALARLPRTAAALARLPRTAAGFGAAVPPGGGLWRGFPARLFLPARYIRLWAGSFFRRFSHTRPEHGKSIRKILPVTLPYFILHRKISEVC